MKEKEKERDRKREKERKRGKEREKGRKRERERERKGKRKRKRQRKRRRKKEKQIGRDRKRKREDTNWHFRDRRSMRLQPSSGSSSVIFRGGISNKGVFIPFFPKKLIFLVRIFHRAPPPHPSAIRRFTNPTDSAIHTLNSTEEAQDVCASRFLFLPLLGTPPFAAEPLRAYSVVRSILRNLDMPDSY